MSAVASWVIFGLVVGFIGFLIGCFTCEYSRKKANNINDKHKPDSDTQTDRENTTEIKDEKPNLLSAPRGGVKDNLQLIKGVGAKIEETLNILGIYHFDQIANLTQEQIIWVDEQISFPGRIARDNWISQAKVLASGEDTEFSKRVENGEVATSKPSKK